MRSFLALLLSASIFSSIVAQEPTFNIYEVNKGEVLKKDYNYLEYLFRDLFAAQTLTDSVSIKNPDATGVINLAEETIIPFTYRNIRLVWNPYRTPNQSYIQLSNGRGVALFEIKSNLSVKQHTKFSFLRFGPFLFDKSYMGANKFLFHFIDLKSGNIQETKLEEINPLTKNWAAAKSADYKWGIIDNDGKTILPFHYNDIRIVRQFIKVEKNDCWCVYTKWENDTFTYFQKH